LTDHDTTAGHEEAAAQFEGAEGVSLLEGLELSCKEVGKTVHLLVYGLDHGEGRRALEARLESINIQRRERIEQILDKLDNLGFVLDRQEIRSRNHGRTPGRPDVAAALVREGICNSMRQAFDRFLRDGGPADVSVERVGLDEGLELGRRAGAKMSLAHPHSLRNVALVEDLFTRYKTAGLEGLEAHYGRYGRAERRHWEAVARKHELVVTAGSDFHGAANPAVGQPVVECEAEVARTLCDWLGVPYLSAE
jgi:predicted metal-dependent phosphoesterase TrpH